MLSRLLAYARGIVRRRTIENEADEELHFHLEQEMDALVARGLTPEEARRRAVLALGGVTQTRDAVRDVRTIWLDTVWCDARQAVRGLAAAPVLTAVAVLSLAAGIGAATAAFAVVDALMLRTLPVPSPEQLVAFSTSDSPGWSRWRYATFQRWREDPAHIYDAVAVYDLSTLEQPVFAAADGAVVPLRVTLVSGNYFDVLGLSSAAGRLLRSSDDSERGRPVAVISDAFWHRHFGRALDVIGRVVDLNGADVEIVGIGPVGFLGDRVGQPTDIWLPLAAHPRLVPGPRSPLSESSPARWLRVMARLGDSTLAAQAAARANVQHQQSLAEVPDGPGVGRERQETVVLLGAATGFAPERQRYGRLLMVLWAIVVLVLLVAGANFVSLLTARGEARQREFAVRLALGASRWRLLQQSLVECALLAATAGLLGLVLSQWMTSAVMTRFTAMIQPIALSLPLDGRLIAFNGACVTGVVLLGIWPTIVASRARPVSTLQRTATGATRRRRNVAGRVLLVAQVAFCFVLVTGSGLLLRSVINLRTQDLGFDRNVLLVTLRADQTGGDGDATSLQIDRIRERLLAIRGIVDVTITGSGLLDNSAYWIDSVERFEIDGRPVEGTGRWTVAAVGARFFETVGIPLRRGRLFGDADFAPPFDAVILSETLARSLFGSVDPIGHRIVNGPISLGVVGVVADARQTSPRDAGLGVMYRPLAGTPSQATLVVRTKDEAVGVIDVVRHHLDSIPGTMAVVGLQTVDQILDENIAQERLLGTLAGWLGILAMAVACVGVHALVSYDVLQRRRELGVRITLGATGRRIVRLVLRDFAWLGAGGLTAGAAISLAVMARLSPMLFGLGPDDPVTLATAALSLVVVALAAATRPTLAAARTSPVVLLQTE